MAAVLQYELAVVGLNGLMRAFDAVDRRAARSAQAQAKAQTRAQAAAVRRARSMGGSAGRATAAGIGSSPAAEQRASQQTTRQLMTRARADEKAAMRAAAARMRIEERSAKQVERIRQRGAERASRFEQRMADRAGRQAAFQAARRREAIRGGVTTGANMLAGAGATALAATGAAVYKQADIDKQVRDLLISGRGRGEDYAMSAGDLTKRVQTAGERTGAGPEAILEAMRAFVSVTGDLKGAIDQMDDFGTFVTATSENAGNLGRMLGIIQNKGQVGKGEAREVMTGLAFGGRFGEFEIGDFAEQAPQLLSAAKTSGIKLDKRGFAQVNALAQMTQGSAGDAAVTKTAIQAMMRSITKKGADWETGYGLGAKVGGKRKAGRDKSAAFSVFKRDKQGRAVAIDDPVRVIADMIDSVGGDIVKIGNNFDQEAMPAIKAMQEIYAAGGGSGGGGRRALMSRIDELMGASDASFSEMQKDAAFMQDSASVKFQMAVDKLQQALASPEMMEAAIQLADAAKALAPALGAFSKDLARILDPFGMAEKDAEAGAASAVGLLDKASAIRVRAREMAKDGLDVGEKKKIMAEFAALRTERDKVIGQGSYDEYTQREYEAERGAALGGMTRSQYDALSEQQKLDIMTSAQVASASIAGAIVEAVNNAASKVGNRGATAAGGAPSRSATAT